MSMSRGLGLLGGGFLPRWPFGNGQPELMIDMRRVNIELRKEALAELEEDVVYRNRVKQRMREGSRCAHPPLIDRKKVFHFAARANGNAQLPANAQAAREPVAEVG